MRPRLDLPEPTAPARRLARLAGTGQVLADRVPPPEIAKLRLEPLLIGCVLFAIFYPRIQNTPFHGDESWWIASSYHLEAFVGGRIDSPVWNESYHNLTQPQLSRYVIGIGRWVGGYGPSDLIRPWNFRLSDEENIARGKL